jgi:flagellar hook protein FlgE
MSLNTAISGLQSFQQQINVVGNNIANVNTTAFKSARTDFEDSFSQALSGGMQVGSGVNLAAIPSNFNQGTISSTGVGSDLAIVGQGFFTVRNATDSTAIYATRAGDFHLDSVGYLITNDGLQVLGVGSVPLQVDPLTVASFSIDQKGFINVVKKDGTTAQSGQVQLVSFADTSQLVKQGDNRYSWTAAAGPSTFAAPQTAGLGTIQSGALELSNVDLTVEMSNLIIAQRAFQANARIITTSDEVMQEVVNLKR